MDFTRISPLPLEINLLTLAERHCGERNHHIQEWQLDIAVLTKSPPPGKYCKYT